MAKGKAKNDSSDSLAPPQPQSLRSRKRKRECQSDEISETDDVQAMLHHQGTEGNSTAVVPSLLQCRQSPLQESSMVSVQQHQAAEQSCLNKQDPATEEKHAEATNVSLKILTVEVFEGQGETTVTNPNNDSQMEGFGVHTNSGVSKTGKDKEEITAEECNGSPSQTGTDQLQVLLPASEEVDGSCATALKGQLGVKENSPCNLDRNQETSHEERSNVYMVDVKEVTKEAVAVLPLKKKRRMGMCGLTEKERTHFLQTQKRENGQNGQERVEKQICNNSVNLVAREEIISSPPLPFSLSIPADSVTEQAEIKLQSSHCGGDVRAETEVHIAVTTSPGTSTVCDPGCSKGKICEADGGMVPGPEQTGDTKSEPPAKEEEEELLGNQEQQELEGSTVETLAEKPQEQMKDGEDGSAAVGDHSPAISFFSKRTQNEGSENWDAIKAAPLQANSVTRTRDEKKEDLTCDAVDGVGAEASASSSNTWLGGFICGPVGLCKAAATPSGSKRKDRCDPDDEPGAGPSTLNADPFGSEYLGYVSDSQLNTIALIEEEVMQEEEDLGSPDCHDATDLICGLISELSSLNRKVMATHRELENLRRSSKSSRSFIR